MSGFMDALEHFFSSKEAEPTKPRTEAPIPAPMTSADRLANVPVPSAKNQQIEARPGIPPPVVRGNIDIHNRPTIHNKDGSISTVESMSFHDDKSGHEVLIPMVVNGKVVGEKEAIKHYYDTGDHLGHFTTPEDADKYAIELHNQQEQEYVPRQQPAQPAPQQSSGIPPGWSPAPVQADNKVPYLMPSGWQAVGQPPPVNTQWQAESAPTSVPAGWAIANQNAAEQAALQQALAQKFGK